MNPGCTVTVASPVAGSNAFTSFDEYDTSPEPGSITVTTSYQNVLLDLAVVSR